MHLDADRVPKRPFPLPRQPSQQHSQWLPGDPTLTVSEIAKRLRPIAPDTQATAIRLRHWTTQSMLVPVQQLHEGTGKHRRYAADDIYIAALLHILTDFGLNLTAVRSLQLQADILAMARVELPTWKKTKQPLYLKVWWRSSGRGVILVNEEEPKLNLITNIRHEALMSPDVLFAVDLARLWSKIEGG